MKLLNHNRLQSRPRTGYTWQITPLHPTSLYPIPLHSTPLHPTPFHSIPPHSSLDLQALSLMRITNRSMTSDPPLSLQRSKVKLQYYVRTRLRAWKLRLIQPHSTPPNSTAHTLHSIPPNSIPPNPTAPHSTYCLASCLLCGSSFLTKFSRR